MTKQISTNPFQKPVGIVGAVTVKSRARRATLKAMAQAGYAEPIPRNDLTSVLAIENRKVSDLRPASR